VNLEAAIAPIFLKIAGKKFLLKKPRAIARNCAHHSPR